MGFFKDIFSLGKELGGIIKDGRREIGEIMTDGFKEIVIKGNEDYKTSYEKRDEAVQVLSNARAHYNSVYNNVQNTYERVCGLVEEHYSYKVDLYQKFQSEYAPFIEEYIKEIQIKKKNFEFSQTLEGLPFQASASSYISSLSIGGLGVPNGSIMQRKRVKEADDMLEEAIEIKVRLNRECEDLKNLKSNLLLVEKVIKEERSIIGRLLEPLKGKVDDAKTMLHASIYVESQVEEAEKIIDIINLLEKTLTTQFLQSEAVITQQYQKLTKQIQSLENQLSRGR
ncbi:hypothetical protein U2H24_19610 [Bacillus cereus]|uniref:hypothetical protein n=1 Tax=Bacillus cereus TaxID=1396 RepID=UPI002ADED3D8|nr:hypothetical protein [Bacillus cereus]MEA1011847.1 hypothetical protein [Bacillus cereus]